MKLFNRLNCYFLHDEDETAHISDYVWFYGMLGFMVFMAFIFTINLITF